MFDASKLTENDIRALNDFEGLATYKKTLVLKWLMSCRCQTICLFTGNQFGKNESVLMDYYYRVIGAHLQPHKNLTPEKKVRTIRFASESLPGEKDGEEVKNTQYPVMKRRFNPSWIKKDITARKPVVEVQPQLGGKPFQFEYVSYGQSVQSGAGVQRESVYIDESCPYSFLEEQKPRLLVSGGDLILSFTPVPGSIGWEFDEFYERAQFIYRTKAVIDRIKLRTGETKPYLEKTASKEDIAVIMAATDDNPYWADLVPIINKRNFDYAELSGTKYEPMTVTDYLNWRFDYPDEDVKDARRYGLFRQLSGKIYKTFGNVHIIDGMKYFPNGLPFDWIHARGIDYHQENPWAYDHIMVSPENEIFVVNDADFPKSKTTWDIGREIAEMSDNYKFRLDLIDPLAETKQKNTNLTTIQDLNRFFRTFKDAGWCAGGWWKSWDTKGTRGREELTMRLMNSVKVGRPFNNLVDSMIRPGAKELLPTIWFFDRCKPTIESMRSWRMQEWGNRNAEMSHDAKESPMQKWSHHPITIECLLKNPIITAARFPSADRVVRETPRYYQRGRR